LIKTGNAESYEAATGDVRLKEKGGTIMVRRPIYNDGGRPKFALNLSLNLSGQRLTVY